jgi:hypothetical protein
MEADFDPAMTDEPLLLPRLDFLAPGQGGTARIPYMTRMTHETRRESFAMLRRISPATLLCGLVLCALSASPALSEVDVRSPWANVYVGPGGVYVNGPWGRVEVPAADRQRVCSEWRKSTTEHYEGRGCTVAFDGEGCLIEKVECGK